MSNTDFQGTPRLEEPLRQTGLLAACAPMAEPIALPIPAARAITGLSRSGIYREAGKGNIVLLKNGRSTLVCMTSVRRFLASLPRARVKASHSR
jgi:hypothetical protein